MKGKAKTKPGSYTRERECPLQRYRKLFDWCIYKEATLVTKCPRWKVKEWCWTKYDEENHG